MSPLRLLPLLASFVLVGCVTSNAPPRAVEIPNATTDTSAGSGVDDGRPPMAIAGTSASARPRRAPERPIRGGDTDGDGLLDDVDLCPTVREDRADPKPEDGCPAMRDVDGDGVPDADDLCPDDPEDRNTAGPRDGCPDIDVDKDGIPDATDQCPTIPETFNGVTDTDGCPDHR